MAKKKLGLANKKLKKHLSKFQKSQAGPSNCFEIHLNKRKFEVLGRKQKHERGLPGISRSRATKQREKTLLVEYQQRHKANTLVDRRFGEYDEDMSLEEKLMKRFTMERQHHHVKSSHYNLEDEKLTHLGQSLGDIEKFDDIQLSDEDKEDGDAEDVKELHFGGFLKKVSKTESGEKVENEQHKTRKEIMEEVVAKSKLKKHERQIIKEEITDLTEQVNEDWMRVQDLLLQGGIKSKKPDENSKVDDYDIAVRELAFDIKGKATNRLKTEEELAKQEEQRLIRLEAERMRRMKGFSQELNKSKHISADDLGDSFTVEKDSRFMLKYQEGQMVVPEENDSVLGVEQYSSDVKYQNAEDKEHKINESCGNEESYDEDDNEEEIDSGSDLQSEDGDEENNAVNDRIEAKDDLVVSRSQQKGNQEEGKSVCADTRELPYTFTAPVSYQEFKSLLQDWSFEDQVKIIERIKVCHHPKISPENKTKMEVLFVILLEYIGDLSSQNPPVTAAIGRLVRHVFDVAQLSPVYCTHYCQEILQSIQEHFVQQCEKKGGKGNFPGLKELVYLKIVSMLFPTSDFRHAVCTPALLLMAQMLTQCRVQTLKDVLCGLFVCNLVFQHVSQSKRFVPEVVSFLSGIIYLASTKKHPTPPLVAPFKPNSQFKDILKVYESSKTRLMSKESFSLMDLVDEPEKEKADFTRVNALGYCIHLLDKFTELYINLPSFHEVFQTVHQHLSRIDVDLYPPYLQERFSSLSTKLVSQEKKQRQVLTLQTRKPQPIQTFEPKFEEHYEMKTRRNAGNKQINERQKLRYKHKKEFKGAVREIRKDNQFLAKQKLKEQLIRDGERAEKVKRIEHLLASEQGEANQLNRKKRKL